jgi:hypothetical protein
MPQHTEAERRRGITPGLISNIKGFEAIPPGVLQRVLGERAGGMAETMADFFTESLFQPDDDGGRMGQEYPGRPGPIDLLIAALGVKGIGSLAKRGYNSLVRPGFGASKTSRFGLEEGPIGRREFFNRASGAPRRRGANLLGREISAAELGSGTDVPFDLRDEAGNFLGNLSQPGDDFSMEQVINMADKADRRRRVLQAVAEKNRFGVDLSDAALDISRGDSPISAMEEMGPTLNARFGGKLSPETVEQLNRIDIHPITLENNAYNINRAMRGLGERGNVLPIFRGAVGEFNTAEDISTALSRGALNRFLRSISDDVVEGAIGPEKREAETAVKEVLDDLFNRFGVRRGPR